MIDSAQAELASLRKLIAEAKSLAPDEAISPGARQFREDFLEATWARFKAAAQKVNAERMKQREG
jgi:hypothetical protein